MSEVRTSRRKYTRITSEQTFTDANLSKEQKAEIFEACKDTISWPMNKMPTESKLTSKEDY